MILKWSWSDPEVIQDITQYYQYYSILRMSSIIFNIKFPIFINITQYYFFNNTQYYISKVYIQYYIILPIDFNIIYSIQPNYSHKYSEPSKTRFSDSMCQYSSILQAISNIHQYSSILPEQLSGFPLFPQVLSGPEQRQTDGAHCDLISREWILNWGSYANRSLISITLVVIVKIAF